MRTADLRDREEPAAKAIWRTRPTLTAAVAATVLAALYWVPKIDRPFPHHHEGILSGRFALHTQNFLDRGLEGSGYLSSMAPFQGTYAHHPPFRAAVQAALATVIGNGEYQTRIYPTAIGVLAFGAVIAFCRQLTDSWSRATVAGAVIIATPMFWFYATVLPTIGLAFALLAVILRDDRSCQSGVDQPKGALGDMRGSWLAVALAAGLTLTSHLGFAIAVAAVAWVVWRRRQSGLRVLTSGTIAYGLVVGLCVAGTVGWLLLAGSFSDLASQTARRTAGGGFSVTEYAQRQYDLLVRMYTPMILPLVALGITSAVRDRRSRSVLFTFGALAVVWMLALSDGSFVHEYWSYPLLLPLAVLVTHGVGRIADAEVFASSTLLRRAVVVLLPGLILALAFGPRSRAPHFDTEPGELAKAVRPPPTQSVAWTSVSTARWLSFYWDLPTDMPPAPDDARAHDTDLVLVTQSYLSSLDDPPRTFVAQGQTYAVVRVGDLGRR